MRRQAMDGNQGTTVYPASHQIAFLELREEITKSGATRKGLDFYIDQESAVDVDELEVAAEAVRNSSVEFDQFLEQVDTVEEFIEESQQLQQ